MTRCYYCNKITWPWNSKEELHPRGYYIIRFHRGNCEARYNASMKRFQKRFRESLVPPDNGYMPQKVKDWIEDG